MKKILLVTIVLSLGFTGILYFGTTNNQYNYKVTNLNDINATILTNGRSHKGTLTTSEEGESEGVPTEPTAFNPNKKPQRNEVSTSAAKGNIKNSVKSLINFVIKLF